MKKSLTALLLSLALIFTLLAGCSFVKIDEEDKGEDVKNNGSEDAVTDKENEKDTEKENENDKKDEEEKDGENKDSGDVSIGFLKGPTGVGAAYFMDKNEAGETTDKYDITIESDVANINSAILSGALDMAAVPTNVAVNLWNKSGGDIQIVAINTLGVLYILENGNTVNSVPDLAGKTIYATGQGSNPQYVLEYILEQNGLTVGEDVTVEYLVSDELATKMAAGDIDICMLPVPNATSVLIKNKDVRTALNITEEWENISDSSILTQGCIVARADTVNEETLQNFLADYEESINYMKDSANLDSAAALAVKYGIIPAEAVAKAAIPDCNLAFITGTDTMRESLADYYEILFSANPNSIGGAVPDDSFYR